AAQLGASEDLQAMSDTLADMEKATTEGFEQFSEADLAFHARVADAAGNPLLQACNEVVRGLVLSTIREKLVRSPDTYAQMVDSLQRHTLVYEAIAARDAVEASRLARKHQYEYYAEYLTPDQRRRLDALRTW
ncbi:MAG: FadR/GntR family transcriptional regulator, partial [Actinomycetes bacterium]